MLSLVLSLLLTQVAASDKAIESYEKNRQSYLYKEEQNRNILAEIYKAQQDIKKINSDKNKLLIKKENIQKQIEKLNPLVQSAEQKILTQKIEIQKRLLFILKFQDMNFLKVVFSSQSPSELDRNLRILRNVTDRDYVLLKTYSKNVKVLKIKQEELLSKKAALAQLEVDILKKEEQLKAKSESKNKMLAEIENQKQKLLSRLQNIRKKKEMDKGLLTQDDKKREEFLSTLFEPLFFEKKGLLKSPIDGKLVQKFGYFMHPKYKTQIRHKGLFIESNTFNEIKSIARGKVAHIEQSKSSGYTIIIDHYDHYYSVYSYVADPNVKVGQEVSEGQLIANSVYSHPFFGEGLYFEMRHFSEPIDPIAWFDSDVKRRMR